MKVEVNKKKKKRKIILIVIGIISVLCVLSVIISLIFDATPQGKARNTEKALTEAAIPTETSIPATAVPTETSTPTTVIPTETLIPTNTHEPTEESYITYVVINDTTLWEYLASEDPCYSSDVPCDEGLRSLNQGVLLKPSDNAYDLNCVDDTVEGITMTFCAVEVIDTGETGWVKRQWIEKK